MTIDAASAPDTKKIATSSMTTTEVIVDSGMCESMLEQGALGRPGAGQVGAAALHVDAGTAEDREPDERHDARHQQHAGHELADGAATRDAGDEHAHERGPADPPGPVEDRPAREPRPAWRRHRRRRCARTSSRGPGSSEPTAVGTRLRMKTVGPTTKTKTASARASTMLMLDSHWMPLATPETADRMKQRVSTAMIATSSMLPALPMPATISKPEPICSAPRPSEAAEPNSVAKIASMSMTRPAGPAWRASPRAAARTPS